jgi:hypothetical protein
LVISSKLLHILGLGQDGTACSWKIGGIASDEASLLHALFQSHEFERLSFLCNSPKRIIACLVPTPILRSWAFSSKDFLLDCSVGDDINAPPFHAAENPLLLDLLGSTGDLYVALSEVEIIAVGGRICRRMFGGFLIGRGRTPLGPNLTPYLEFDDFFLQHPI